MGVGATRGTAPGQFSILDEVDEQISRLQPRPTGSGGPPGLGLSAFTDPTAPPVALHGSQEGPAGPAAYPQWLKGLDDAELAAELARVSEAMSQSAYKPDEIAQLFVQLKHLDGERQGRQQLAQAATAPPPPGGDGSAGDTPPGAGDPTAQFEASLARLPPELQAYARKIHALGPAELSEELAALTRQLLRTVQADPSAAQALWAKTTLINDELAGRQSQQQPPQP